MRINRRGNEMSYKKISFLLCMWLTHIHASAQYISIPGTPDENKLSLTLLKAATKRIDMKLKYPYAQIKSGNLSSTRISQDIERGYIDIMWNMTSTVMEEKYTAIYIPIYRGLLGMRIPLVKKENQNIFSGVTNLHELKQYKAGSGKFWPDTSILQHNGMPVVGTLKYQNLFPMLEGERFDYFPRGLHEPWQEIDNFKKLNLAVENNVLIKYTAPNYFFVKKSNKKLAALLTSAFNEMIADGSYTQLFFADDEVQSALSKANIQHRTVFSIENPSLSKHTPTERKELWYDPMTGE